MEEREQRSRSRDRKYRVSEQKQTKLKQNQTRVRPLGQKDFLYKQSSILRNTSAPQRIKSSKGQLSYHQFLAKQEQFHANQELLRSFLRIQQSREQPIDKFVKILYIYKGKLKIDNKIVDIMKEPKRYLNKLRLNELQSMLPEAQIHLKAEKVSESKYIEYWKSLIDLIHYKIQKKSNKSTQEKPQFKAKVKQMINKPIPDLIKLEETIKNTLKNPIFNTDMQYWHNILQKIKGKKIQSYLIGLYQNFQSQYVQPADEEEASHTNDQIVNTSPILVGSNNIIEKNITTDEQERKYRSQIAEKIFKEQFEKGRQKLETNLSLPKNHNLLSTNIIADSSTTYDFISKQILEFQKYKRLQEDEQEFDDWVPTETEGRFRDCKPIYLNRVRVSCQWNKYNQTHFTDDNPPPKTIQGYKFNIFYPDLYDKQKTPQYYLQNMESPDYCVIKFKAGPPYKDIAFKIQKREWDFSQKSGFESIFAKGILHLYFNFKKPRFRI